MSAVTFPPMPESNLRLAIFAFEYSLNILKILDGCPSVLEKHSINDV